MNKEEIREFKPLLEHLYLGGELSIVQVSEIFGLSDRTISNYLKKLGIEVRSCEREDLTGRKFGRLTVIKDSGKRKHKQTVWVCECVCGNITEVIGGSLRDGHNRSCKCLWRERMAEVGRGRRINLINQRFGRLVVIGELDRKAGGRTRWVCKCDCGNIKEVVSGSLRGGSTKSCGCIGQEGKSEQTIRLLTKHGESRTGLNGAWRNMKYRCYNPDAKLYPRYGARGIQVCNEWLDKKKGFINFRDFSLSHGYREGLAIDRIDNKKNYCPENCQFLTLSKHGKKTQRDIRDSKEMNKGG